MLQGWLKHGLECSVLNDSSKVGLLSWPRTASPVAFQKVLDFFTGTGCVASYPNPAHLSGRSSEDIGLAVNTGRRSAVPFCDVARRPVPAIPHRLRLLAHAF